VFTYFLGRVFPENELNPQGLNFTFTMQQEQQRTRCWFEDDALHIVIEEYGHHATITPTTLEIQTQHEGIHDFALSGMILQREDPSEGHLCTLLANVNNGKRQEIVYLYVNRDYEMSLFSPKRAFSLYEMTGQKGRPPYCLDIQQSEQLCSADANEFKQELEKAATAWCIPCVHVYPMDYFRTCIERGETCC